MDFLIIEGVFLAITVVASLLFYQRIKRAQEEYEASKQATKNIVVSFFRELSKERKRRETISVAVDAATNRSFEALRLSEENQSITRTFSDKLDKATQDISALNEKIETLNNRSDLKREVIVDRKPSAETAPLTAEPPPSVSTGRGAVLSKLNPTEITVLDILEREGEMTAPKIRERIGRTREHTARLLKKLYDNGFIDRVTGSMPYKYKIRKELRDLLAEQKTDVAA